MSLLGVFQPIKKLLGLGVNKTVIDTHWFRVQTKVSASLLLVLALLANGRQYFGEPIRCKARTGRTLSQRLVDSYCWVTGTYTLTGGGQDQATGGGLDQAHPGVGVLDTRHHGKVVHIYYQWVSFILILQAAIFYLPRFVWKMLECSRMLKCSRILQAAIFYLPRFAWKMLECSRMRVAVEGMDGPEMDDEKLDKRTEKLLRNLYKYEDHRWYSFFFIICEILNCLNIIIQIIITDKFLGGRFVDYGSRYLEHALSGDHDFVHPLHTVFPHVTSCSFALHGRGGDVVEHDIVCVLPLNIINEKIFLVLWAWMWCLAAVALANMVYRVLTVTSPKVRNWIFRFGIMTDVSNLGTQVCGSLDYGQWFYIRLIRKNVDGATFGRFIQLLADQKGRKIPGQGDREHDKFSPGKNVKLGN